MRFEEPTPEQLQGWKEWVESRPESVRKVAERFEPWSLYRMGETGQRVTISSFSEDGTVTVGVTGEFNLVLFDRSVFGIDPNDLTPCDLPAPGEVLGAALSDEQVEDNIDEVRLMVRPDLWKRAPDGRIVWAGPGEAPP